MGNRLEKDFLGAKELAESVYYGVQTLRAKENFHITGIPMSLEPNFVKTLDARIAEAIAAACERLGHRKGDYQYVSPNDHVNYGQWTNDVYPTAFRLALIFRLSSYVDAAKLSAYVFLAGVALVVLFGFFPSLLDFQK